MNSKHICATMVAASLILIPAEKVRADEAAALIGGALLGGIIVNEVHKNKQRQRQATTTTTRRTYQRSGISSAQRQQNREVQTALNYFGYNVGTVDGALGRRSRAGISSYQAEMGYPIDGYLDDHERAFLLTSHQRALASGHVPPYNQILASQGQAGLLRTYRNEQLGIVTPQVAQPQVQQATAPAPAPAPAPQPSLPARANNTGALPDFTFGQTQRSANDHCNQVNVLTAANGGLSTAQNISEPSFALNEQFCLARIQAMAESSRIEATITNLTPEQIEQQCEGLTQAIAPQLEGIEASSAGQVISKTSAFLQSSGQPMDQLASGAKVCLGVGYRTDDAEMALASGVMLTSAGQLGYGEMVSHHLREGFGSAKATGQQAAEWMRLALNAAQGGTPVLGQTPDRLAVLNAAVNSTGTGTAALPVFPAPSGN